MNSDLTLESTQDRDGLEEFLNALIWECCELSDEISVSLSG